MSDVLIKGMEMPTSCHLCEFCIDKNAEIELTKASYICERTGSIVHAYAEGEKSRIDEKTGRIPECPLVEVPLHGRLVDADKMFSMLKNACCTDSLADTIARDILEGLIKNAPTVVEASTEERE